LFAPKSMHT